MGYKNKFIVTMLATTVLCLSANADMIVNGSFESSSSYGTYISGGSTAITGWKVLGHSIDRLPSTYWQSSNGYYSIDLNGSYTGGIQQIIDTEIGTTYKVTFDMSGNYRGTPTIKTFNVSAVGTTIQTESFSFNSSGSNSSNMGWITESWTFTADSATTTLQFISTSYSNAGAALDNVRMEEIGCVNPVPVPGAFLLGMIGMGIAGIKTRKSRI